MKKSQIVAAIIFLALIVLFARGLAISAHTETVTEDHFVNLPLVQKGGDDVIPTLQPTFGPTPSGPTPSSPPTTGNVEISYVLFVGNTTNESDEYAEIYNADNHQIQLKDWTIRDQAGHIYTFPDYVIDPGETCRVYTNEDHPEYCGFNIGSPTGVWNDGFGCAYVWNTLDVEVDQFCYTR